MSTNHAVTIQALWSSVQSEQAIVDQLGKPFVRTCYTSEKHQFKISSGKPSFLYMVQFRFDCKFFDLKMFDFFTTPPI